MLGAVSDDSEEFYGQFDEYITGDHARKFILALRYEFDEDLIVVLDGAPQIHSSTVAESNNREDLELVRLPPYSPDMNPVEGWWRQLKESLKKRFVEELADLKQAMQRGLDDISTQNMSNYL